MFGKSLGLGLVLAACLAVGQGPAQGEPYTWKWGPQSVSVEYGTVNAGVRTRSGDLMSDARVPSTDWSVVMSQTAAKDINTSFRAGLTADYYPSWAYPFPSDQFVWNPVVGFVTPIKEMEANPTNSPIYYGTGEARFQLTIDPAEKCQYNLNVVSGPLSKVINQEITFKTLGGTDLGLSGTLSESAILSGRLWFDVTTDSTLLQSAVETSLIVTLDVVPTGKPLAHVPEPGALTLLGSGVLGLAAFGLTRWRRRRANQP